jgi:endonuclease/exonuclease/phosphatase family metal-dependent hydrolase
MRWLWLTALLGLAGCDDTPELSLERSADTVRVATYNTHLARGEAGKLIAELKDGSAQVDGVVRVIKAANPDILLLNELDFDEGREALALFQERLADVGLEYAYSFVAPVNTGKPTELDLTGDGKDYGPDNAQGWGVFEGQFGMAILSRLPILSDDVRTFAGLRWSEMPDNLYPLEYYPDEALEVLRLSSKSHWDVPVQVGDKTIHLLASHPTPPVFDGDEDCNGRRNHDEIRFWADYIEGKEWMLSDQGTQGGLEDGAAFIILGDLNNDPVEGDGRHEAIKALIEHPRIEDTTPKGSAGTATSDFEGVGKLRVDYVLPSKNLSATGSGVLWPPEGDPLRELVASASDHRLVWVDLSLSETAK